MSKDNADYDKLKDAHRRMAEFAAYCEVAENKVFHWMQAIQETMEMNQKALQEQLQLISDATHEAQEVITYFNTAKLKINFENALLKNEQQIEKINMIGQEHLKAIETNSAEFQKMAKKSFEKLDRASTYTIKNISDAISSFRISDFQRFTEQSCEQVKDTSKATIIKLRDITRWFHWKNMAMVVSITLFVTLSMGLYLNDELPWEAHKRVVMQRNAGQALINAWPSLNQTEQQKIINQAKKSFL